MQFLTMDGTFGNPASRSHRFGWQAEEARLISPAIRLPSWSAPTRAKSFFTSGATESDNLAIKGAANFYQKKRQAHHHQQKPSIKRFWIPAVSWSAKASK